MRCNVMRHVDRGQSRITMSDVRHLSSLLFVAAVAVGASGCGSSEPTVIPGPGNGDPTGTGGTDEPGGMGGTDPGTEPGGTGGTGGTTSSGDGGTGGLGDGSQFVSVPGVFQPGDEPEPVSPEMLPNILEITALGGVTNGGSVVLRVTLAAPVDNPTFVVRVNGDNGYYHTVQGTDAGAGSYDIEVQINGSVQQTSLTLALAVTDGAGNIGQYREFTLPIVRSGFGDVKVTLTFDSSQDLDLSVVEPGGAEISFRNPVSPFGGRLDLDSGSNCVPSASNAENIFWPTDGAPVGEYRIRVHYFEQCVQGAAVNFSVHVENRDEVATYRGSFADGTQGTFVDVATFTH